MKKILRILKVIIIAIGTIIALPGLLIYALHKMLLKIIAYRWLLNSVAFPYQYARLKRHYKTLSLTSSGEGKLAKIWHYNYQTKFWSDKFWFAKRYHKLLNKHILLIEI